MNPGHKEVLLDPETMLWPDHHSQQTSTENGELSVPSVNQSPSDVQPRLETAEMSA